ncbi:hypothetical protein PRLR6025_19590 [Prevotella lacticifex]|uniref:hypothetical protein n=1 Tax=Prevotella lacticifex TaxID=2854755 RepID=UPI001CC4F666|nr:hypothetical protein [Prevotella lacticifex]GJG68490.1 hypothetical protein PRLR6025_19590 [Prevotella lacticifex]
MKKKQYVKPQTEKIISFEFPCLLKRSESYTANPDEPGAKKNIWDSDDEEDDSLNGFTRVGGSTNKLWDD